MTLLSNPVLLGTGIVVVTALTAATISAKRRSKLPELFMQQTAFNRAVLSRCPTINSLYDFFPFISLNGYALDISLPFCLRPWTSRSTLVGSHIKQIGACRHIETILASRLRRSPALDPYARRILRLPDGGSVALDFEDFEHVQDLPQDAPVVILLPGLVSCCQEVLLDNMTMMTGQP